MDSAQKALIEIASVSREIVNTLVRSSGRKTIESFQLDKIVVGCGAILEALNKASLLAKDRIIDDRLRDWLSSEEPQICLGVLKQMESLLRAQQLDHGHGIKSLFQTSRSASTKDKSGEAIRLFQKNKACFHFLLTTEVWNREGGTQQQPPTGPESAPAMRINDVADNQSVTKVSQNKNVNPSGAPQGRKTKRPRINTKKLNLILEWLNALKCGETYERTLLLRQPDTCTWLPNTDAYRTWKSTDNSFLWLHGKAGAGKSVLAASVIEGLKNSLQDGEVLGLFYCDFRNERSTNAIEVMRSILAQLLQQFAYHTVDAGDLIEELVKEKDDATSIVSNGVVLARYISRAAKLFSRQPFIVIDALDECEDVERLLDALLALNKGGGIRLFVTSRPHLVIKNSFSYFPLVSMEAMKYAVSRDVKLHVTREVDSHLRLRVLDGPLKDEIYTKLCEKADGMFRWVQCQLNVLKRCVTAVQVREALGDLPTDLNETYERILLNASKDKQGSQVVRHALDWLVAALKPLHLSQVVEGLSIDLERRTLDRDSGPAHGIMLLDVLGSLVAYDEATDIVILSHFSVKEYLTGQPAFRNQPGYYIRQQDAHEQLALRSMCYVCNYLQQSGGHEGSRSNAYSPRNPRHAQYTIAFRPTERHQPPSEPHSLLEYVDSHGLRHLAHVNPRKKTILKAIETLQSVAQQYPSEWEQFCERARHCYPPWPTLEHDIVLYILIAFAPEPLLRSFLGRSQLKPKDGTNPLIYAAKFDKMEHTRTLISRGASVNRRGWGVLDRQQILPIKDVITPWHFAMFDLFLNAGSSVPHELFVDIFQQHCFFPAHTVSRLLQTDEFVEWASNVEDQGQLLLALDFTRYPSQYGPSEQEVNVIERRLAQVGCDPPARLDETSLRQAVSAGHVSTVQNILLKNMLLPPDIILDASRSKNPNTEILCLLLSKGCSVNVTSPIGDTPLHLITRYPEGDCLEGIEVLIDAGCNPSACNLVGETPLHLAVARGHTAVVEHLLLSCAPLPPDILLMPLIRLRLALVQLLLRKGADVQVIAANGDTPLHVVLGEHYGGEESLGLEYVQILVDAGCNPFSSNAHGETPFDLAAKANLFSVMEYLLSLRRDLPFSQDILFFGDLDHPKAIQMIQFLIDNGADVHARCSNGNTLLHRHLPGLLVSPTECLGIIKFLINAGCDPCLSNLAGETPFHVAAKRQDIPVMEHLLTLGISVPPDIILTQFYWGCSNPSSVSRSCSTIRFLCEHGGDIHTCAENGDTILHSKLQTASTYGVDEQRVLSLARFLVGTGCDPTILNAAHETPLHSAARGGYISVIGYFLSLDIPLPPDILLAATSSTDLHRTKLLDTIPYLIDKGADISLITNDGDGPLHLLLANHGEEYTTLGCVRMLVGAGCDPCSQNKARKTPLHNAASNGFLESLKYFLSRGLPLPHDILRNSTPKTIRFILSQVMDSVSVNIDEELMHRVFDSDQWPNRDEDCLECARILIGSGYEATSRNASGETPMHVAARRGRLPVIKYLLSQNVPLPTDVLLTAVPPDEGPWRTERRIPLLNLLIGEGASTNIANSAGDTPLHFAIRRDFSSAEYLWDRYHRHCWELVRILLEHGSNPDARNADGETPLDLAEAKGHLFKENFLRLVRKYGAVGPHT